MPLLLVIFAVVAWLLFAAKAEAFVQFKFKDGVNQEGVKEVVFSALRVAHTIYSAAGSELVVTSLNDGTHMSTSKHYQGLAADLRTNNLSPTQRTFILYQLIGRLTPFGFQVIDEGDHFHIEYDPK